jgi:O-antigen ligase
LEGGAMILHFRKSLSIVVGLLAFLVPALALLTPRSTSVGLGLLVVIGLISRAFFDLGKVPTSAVMKSLLIFAGIFAVLGFFRQEAWGYFHTPLYVILSIAIVWAFRMNPQAIDYSIIGAIFGAMFGCVQSIMVIGFSSARETGVMNPIPYGGIGLILAMVGLSTIFGRGKSGSDKYHIILGLIGFFSGVLCSLMSGSKSGWLSFLILPAVLLFKLGSRNIAAGRRSVMLLIFGVVLAIVLGLSVLPARDRLIEATDAIFYYLKVGVELREYSIGPRLQLWQFGLDAFFNNPIFGVGRQGMWNLLSEKVGQGLYDPFLKSLYTVHNEFLNAAVIGGVVGLASLVMVYVAMFRMGSIVSVSAMADRHAFRVRFIAYSLWAIAIALGVGEVVWFLADLRNFFLFWICIISAVGCSKENEGA